MIQTVYQFCNKCNTERAHFFPTNDTLECRACHKSYRVATTRGPLEVDTDLIHMITTGPAPMAIAQPKALLSLLQASRR